MPARTPLTRRTHSCPQGIFALYDLYSGIGLPYAYGLSIISFVLGVKLVTLPLNWQQFSSTSKMKAMKPQQELVRKWYGDNKDMLNMQTGVLFEKFNVNPLAGCLPSLAQIPVFLGVYYSVTSIAKAQIFQEGFLWIPNLSGPIADRCAARRRRRAIFPRANSCAQFSARFSARFSAHFSAM